jgi:hypothetical protein
MCIVDGSAVRRPVAGVVLFRHQIPPFHLSLSDRLLHCIMPGTMNKEASLPSFVLMKGDKQGGRGSLSGP